MRMSITTASFFHMVRIFGTCVLLSVCMTLPLSGQEDSYQANIPADYVKSLDVASEMRRNGDDTEAIDALERIVQERSDYFLAHYNLALAYANDGNHEKAMESFLNAVDIRERLDIPEFSIYNSVGWIHLIQGNYEDAERYLERALENILSLDRDVQVRVLNNMGILYMYKGDHPRSEEMFIRSVNDYGSRRAKNYIKMLNDVANNEGGMPGPESSGRSSRNLLVPRNLVSLNVTSEAKKEGDYGLRYSVAGPGSAFVQDDSPDGEVVYRARFDVNLEGLSFESGGSFDIFTGSDSEGRVQLLVSVIDDGFRKWIKVGLRQNDGTYLTLSNAMVLDGWHNLEVEWVAASGPSAADGYLALWFDGQLLDDKDLIRNSEGRIDFVKLGVVHRLEGGVDGFFDIDTFESFRVLSEGGLEPLWSNGFNHE